MGVSRDYTERPSRSVTAVLERGTRTREEQTPVRQAYPEAPSRPSRPNRPGRPSHAPGESVPRGSGQRLGSRQVVSIRGRRTQPIKSVGPLPKVSFIAITMLIGGVVLALALSGVATQQTFRINSLVAQESQLSNEIETLNRDLENVSSSAELARRAQEMGMVVPQQPGILTVEETGRIAESRPANADVSPIINVNGEPVRPGQASSDPNHTEELGDNLEAIPEGEQSRPGAEDENAAQPAPQDQPAPAPPVANVAPYSNGAPAPAPEDADANANANTEVPQPEPAAPEVPATD